MDCISSLHIRNFSLIPVLVFSVKGSTGSRVRKMGHTPLLHTVAG